MVDDSCKLKRVMILLEKIRHVEVGMVRKDNMECGVPKTGGAYMFCLLCMLDLLACAR